jgi:hypothetical protein
MLRLKYLVATLVLALTTGYANADTFDVIGAGALSGTIDINVTSGTITSASLNVAGGYGAFNTILNSTSSGPFANWELDVINSTYETTILFKPDSLVGFIVGNITTWQVSDYPCLDPSGFCTSGLPNGESGTISAVSTDLGTTPLPAALPLFATGLGALGLLGWRRKRKSSAIAA